MSAGVLVAVKAAAPEAPSFNPPGPRRGHSPAVQPSYASELCWAVCQLVSAMCFVSGCIQSVGRATNDPFSLPELGPLKTPEFASVLATLLVVTSEALLAQQQTAPATASASNPSTVGGSRSSSTTNSSNGSPGSSTVSDSRTATSSPAGGDHGSGTSKGKAVHRWVKQAIKDLPECTKALLETLGMDCTAVVWAAVQQAAAQRDDTMFGTVIAARGFRNLTLAFSSLMCCLSPPAAEGVTVVMSPICEQALRQQLLLLVPATLLHWASNTRATTYEDVQRCALIAWFAGDIFSCWLRSSKVVVAELPSDTGSNLQAGGPWLQPYFPAAWLQQVLPDLQKVLALLLQQPGGPSTLTSADSGLSAEAPGQLVRLQCRILQSAVGRDEKVLFPGETPPVGCAVRSVQRADEHELMQRLAECRSVTVQTLTSLEGFIRASAQQLAAGSLLNSMTKRAINAVNAALVSIDSLWQPESGPLVSLAVAAGPGSPEQQQLYSLLSSLLKLSALMTATSLNSSAQASPKMHSSLIEATVSAGIALLSPVDCRLAQDSEECDNSSSSSSLLLSSRSSSSISTQHPAGGPSSPTVAPGSLAAPSAAAAIALLPSLVLIGRCFLVWAQQLHQMVPQLLQIHARGGPTPSPWSAAQALTASALSCMFERLTDPVVAQQLAAAGHDTQQLLLLLQDLLSAQRTVTEAWPSDAISDGFTEATAMALVQQLQVTGRALAGLAVPTMCCNPCCSNIAGPSDLQLVSGRSCLCGGCRTARYCSRVCQKAAWKQHKPACSALAAAAATAAVTGGTLTAELKPEPAAAS